MKVHKISKMGDSAKVVALCLSSVVLSLIGLAALSRKKGAAAVVATKRPGPKPRASRHSGSG